MDLDQFSWILDPVTDPDKFSWILDPVMDPDPLAGMIKREQFWFESQFKSHQSRPENGFSYDLSLKSVSGK